MDEHAARRDHEAMHPRQEHRPASSSSTSSTSSNCLPTLPPLGRLDSPGMIARLLGANAALLFLLLFLATIRTAVCLDHVSSGNGTFVSNGNNGTDWQRAAGQSSVAEQLPKNRSTKLSYFTNWSEWSVCDRHCTQNRVRRCRVKKKCSATILKEERTCQHNRKGRWWRCKQHQRRGHRPNDKFHVIQVAQMPRKEAEPREGRQRGNDQSVGYYGKWSKWSPCTRLCTTQRHKWCKKPGICGHNMIRESAYCYVEGSFCQRWFHRRIRGSREEDNDDIALDEEDLNRVDSFVPDKNTHTWKCGVRSTQKPSLPSRFKRIIGGRPSIPGSWPWQVAVLNRFHEAFCGGTLVSPRWVLTAAHCIRKRLYVRIGEHDPTRKEGTELELRVDSVTIHPEYDADTMDNDIAMLRLSIAITALPSRGIACLPAPNQSLPAKQLCTIIGWGKLRVTDDFGTDVLHEARIPIISPGTCRDVYVDYRITDNMFCAGYEKRDTCAGDSGGPLLCRDPRRPNHPWTIFGITSFGEGCGKLGKFGIYTRLSNYVRWISRVMKETDDAN